MRRDLPTFRWHQDPVRTGVLEHSDLACSVCGTRSGFAYRGPVFGEREPDALCPWCIADGTAHARLQVEFHDAASLPDGLDEALVAEVCQRTPGILSLQPLPWPACCGLPMAYLGPAGAHELRAHHADAVPAVLTALAHDFGLDDDAARARLDDLRTDTAPTAHLFRCTRCRASHGAIDLD